MECMAIFSHQLQSFLYDWKKIGEEKIEFFFIIVRALYGLKFSGASWFRNFAETLSDLYLIHSKWGKNIKIYISRYGWIFSNITQCENNHVISEKRTLYNQWFNDEDLPTDYLVATIRREINASVKVCWKLSSNQYLLNSIKAVKQNMASKSANKYKSPMSTGYRAEIDTTQLLSNHWKHITKVWFL